MDKKNDKPAAGKTSKTEVKPKPATQTITNPSDKLANLLRREGVIAAKVKRAQDELKAVQADILKLWEARNEQAKALLNNNAGEKG